MVFENQIVWKIDVFKILALAVVVLLLVRGEVKVGEYLDIQQEEVKLKAREVTLQEKARLSSVATSEVIDELNRLVPDEAIYYDGDINLSDER
ncbi:hypothetical protein LCGC14_3160670 [marine sediment metagenome]|uniref:Uncharacterized protein n=1 Tax=marine sediment metagenome TaxID=412755 RepID=A0A0F8VRG5_9ZZZZ